MVAAKEEKICGSDLGETCVRRFSSKARLRRSHSRFEQRQFPYRIGTAEGGNRFGVDFLNGLDGKMGDSFAGLLAHAKRRIVRA